MSHPISRDPWFPYRTPRRQAHLRLFCFPHAGGGASVYRAWSDDMAPEIEIWPVQLPGREHRFREPPLRSIQSVVEQLTTALQPYMDMPFAFFGHSMGALVAYELAQALRRGGRQTPVHLAVSGREAPHVRSPGGTMHDLSDHALMAALRRFNGTPTDALGHPELLHMVLPLLRADFEAHETYAYGASEPLDCPISAFGGLADPDVDRDSLAAWQRHTRGELVLRMFPGDHFFIRQARRAVVRTLGEILLSMAPHRQESSLRRESEL